MYSILFCTLSLSDISFMKPGEIWFWSIYVGRHIETLISSCFLRIVIRESNVKRKNSFWALSFYSTEFTFAQQERLHLSLPPGFEQPELWISLSTLPTLFLGFSYYFLNILFFELQEKPIIDLTWRKNFYRQVLGKILRTFNRSFF